LRAGDAEVVVGALPTIPTFVLPYKRFAAPCLLSLAKQYLHVAEEQQPAAPTPPGPKRNARRVTYRSAVRHDRRLIGYRVQPRKEEGHEDLYHQPVIPPSLLWRFVGWLGSLPLALDKAREMILKHDPNSTCHRVGGSVDPFKARSNERMQRLETARQLLLIMPEWESCFDRPFFPQFATRSGFS
jgi:hypothetical protein